MRQRLARHWGDLVSIVVTAGVTALIFATASCGSDDPPPTSPPTFRSYCDPQAPGVRLYVTDEPGDVQYYRFLAAIPDENC